MKYRLKSASRRAFLLLGDVTIVLLALLIATQLRPSLTIGKTLTPTAAWAEWPIFLLALIIWAIGFIVLDVYNSQKTQRFLDEVQRLIAAHAGATLVFAGALYFSFRETSRLQVLFFAFLGLILLLAYRLAHRVLRIGVRSTARQVKRVVKHAWSGLESAEKARLLREDDLATAMGPDLKVATYSPQTRLHDSLWTILKHFGQEFKRTRWQIWVTFKRDFVSTYTQTTVGFLWSVVLPLIPLTVYILLAYLRVLKTTENMPFVVYIAIGITIWTFLSGSLTSPIQALQKSKMVLETSKYPMLAVILSNFGQMVFDMMVRIIFVTLALLYYHIPLSWHLLLLPLLILPLALFSLSLGIILSILNVIARDIQNVVDIVMRYGIFLSSVIFPMSETGLTGALNLFNPFNTFVNSLRYFIVLGDIPSSAAYWFTSAISVVLFLTACKVLYMMEYRLKAYL